MTDTFETNLPNMPHTFACPWVDCRVMFFVEDGPCPSCGSEPVYRVTEMKYHAQRK